MNTVHEKIKTHLSQNIVFLYMKGDRSFPQCGFSARVIQILDSLGAPYETYDVLSDPELREEIKNYSNWKTFPQLYVNEELVGGCDIITSLYQSGELKQMIDAAPKARP